ncbi:MAG: insulinase family protein [Deltaproteobacteria bacterium]|nr:insulinase family protein [Deltaproteobacteria bacterium]
MPQWVGLLAVLAPLLASAQVPSIAAQRAKLPNGLDLVVVEDHRLPVASVQLWVKAGSARASAAQPELAALAGRLLWAGSGGRSGARSLPPAVAVGGESNCWTTADVTVFADEVMAPALEVALRAQGERVRARGLDDRMSAQARLDVERLRSVGRGQEPWSAARESLFALSFQSHPYRWPTLGWANAEVGAQLEDVRAFIRRHYLPNNATLVVVGDVTLAAVKGLAARHLGAWKRGPLSDAAPAPEPAQQGPRRTVLRAAAAGSALLCGVRAPAYADADRPPLQILTRILAQNRDSRLHRALVDERTLAYLVQGELVPLAQPGLLYIGVAVRPGQSAAAAEKVLLAEMDRLCVSPVTAAELDRARRQLEAEYVFSLESVGSLASRLGEATVLGGDPELVNREPMALRAVDAAAVQRVAQRYLVEDRRALVQLLPTAPSSAPTALRPVPAERWLREEFGDE